MPIAPKPLTYQCPQCGWQKTVAPKSDALMPGHTYYSQCPKCQNPALKTKPANPLNPFTQISQLIQTLQKRP